MLFNMSDWDKKLSFYSEGREILWKMATLTFSVFEEKKFSRKKYFIQKKLKNPKSWKIRKVDTKS